MQHFLRVFPNFLNVSNAQPWHGMPLRKLLSDKKIKELRKARKLSQEELAEAVGTTRQTITSIEIGKYTASLPLAYKISHYFGLTIEDVFDFSDLEND